MKSIPQAQVYRAPAARYYQVVKRRGFLALGLSTPAFLNAQKGPPTPQRVEDMRPDPDPAIALNHLGFLPDARKLVLFRQAGDYAPTEFSLRDIAGPKPPFQQRHPLRRATSGVVDLLIGDFSEVEREGMYQIAIGGELSVPFFIRPDVWRRTLPKAVDYYRYQRCGVEVRHLHPACHLDDARRRDDGRHTDVSGGWHDAGDLRKWMSTTLLNGIALLRLARNLGDRWDAAGPKPLLDEVRWGNRYFHKMQDTDGQVWADTAGGVNGDNSDNHWTDNRNGTADDRYINTSKSGFNQALFVTLQAMSAQAYAKPDAAYAKTCLDAATRCWQGSKRDSGATRDQAWWAIAALEMHRATKADAYAGAASVHAANVHKRQAKGFAGEQKVIRGYWQMHERDAAPYNDAVHSAMPAIALLETASAYPKHQHAAAWRDAVRLHLDEYVLPMTARSAYAIMPFGVFLGSPTPELYRELAGELTYRYFMPVRKQFWWLGMTSHLENYALLLAMAAKQFGRREYRDLAYRQLEWIMGANPFGACLMTGEGMRNPYPHSRFVGLIPGGIMNGIAGNANDEPVLDMENGFDWRTTEYWSPHNAWYIWTHSVLE